MNRIPSSQRSTRIFVTLLCVPIFVTDEAQAKRDIARAVEAGADIVELRIDRMEHNELVKSAIAKGPIPQILTCRPTWEGGFSIVGDEDRIEALEIASKNGDEYAEYIDVELKTVNNLTLSKPSVSVLAGDLVSQLILSSHDFAGRPERLYNLVSQMNKAQADVNKLAWTARTIRDNLEAFEILQAKTIPTIAICMGEAGLISRVLAKKFGAFLTFASLDADSGTAPGQITIADMKNLYRWDAINADTKVFGVVADPVRHSMSPAVHNAAFSATDYNGVYLPMLVEGSYESFKAFMETFVNFQGLDLTGLSITIPHKENALRYLREKNARIEPLAEQIGAVNTIAIQRESGSISLSGTNTDHGAILDSIAAKLGIDRSELRNLKVAVLGAGGTGRTAVAALASCGATVSVFNRTTDRARALAEEFNGKTGSVAALDWDQISKTQADVWINTTSLGMSPKTDASPFDNATPPLSSKSVVFDTVYNPMKTRLLAQADAAGAQTISGVEMFVRQAAAQFQTWTGIEPPREVMRKVIETRLNR